MSTDGRPPVFKAVGISLAIASGLFIGVSFVLKKVGLLKANAKYHEEAGEGYGYLKNAYWWSGMTLMILGEICNFVAYAFVDAILVTPLGALSVVVTTILSAIFLKERLSFVGKVACFLCIIGSVVIVINAPQQSSVKDIQQMQHYFIAPGFLSYAGVILVGCVCVAFFAAPRWGKKSMLVYLTICSLIGGLSVVSIQGLGAAVTAQAGGEQQFNQWFLYVLLVFVICTLVTEIIYLNKALNLFNAALVTPTYYVYFTSATIVSSAILFQGFSGTPVQIITIVMGFLIICSGVVLLQLAKSSKDVPDTQVFTGDFSDIRTIAEQEQPESEPKADALRGTAAIVRRLSLSRQKWEQEEARRVAEDKLRDQLEPIGENEQVEWDGLRRRKTLRTDRTELQRRKSMHPPLGMTHFPTADEEEKDTSVLPTLRSPTFLHSRSRGNSAASAPLRGGHFAQRPEEQPIPENAEFDPDGKRARAGTDATAESHEMTHVYGMPSVLRSQKSSRSGSVRGSTKNKPIAWASDERPETARSGGTGSAAQLAPPTPRSGNRRQFSFQNMFSRAGASHGNAGHGEVSPSTLPWPHVRTPSRETHGVALKGATEEERLGLVTGDSRTGSGSDEDGKGSERSGSVPRLGSPPKQRKASRSDAAVASARGPYAPAGTWSSSSPDVRGPPPSRPLPDTPPEQATHARRPSNQRAGPTPPPPPPHQHVRQASQPDYPSQPGSRRASPERVRLVTPPQHSRTRSYTNEQQQPPPRPGYRRGGSHDDTGGRGGAGGPAFI